MNNDFDYQKWFNFGNSYFGFGEYFQGDNPPKLSITSLLALERANLKPFTKDIIDYFETNEDFERLKWGVRAYSQFQDILGISARNIQMPLENRHYCYYESLVYLRESIISWLDKNVLAAITLLRPFLELSVLHIYWFIRCENADSGYRDFYKWMEGQKRKPPLKSQVDYIFNHLPTKDVLSSSRLKERKQFLLKEYKVLCSYNHTPKMEESIARMSGGIGNVSLESFYYYLANFDLLLRQIVYLYVLTYPMSLFPVDRFKKWGYGGVVGLYFDANNAAIIKKYLGPQNCEKLKAVFSKLERVSDLLNWFDSLRDLSTDEIEIEWTTFEREYLQNKHVENKGERIAKSKAHIHAIGWIMNYVDRHSDLADNVSDEELSMLLRKLENW